jgi:hypothetical protein
MNARCHTRMGYKWRNFARNTLLHSLTVDNMRNHNSFNWFVQVENYCNSSEVLLVYTELKTKFQLSPYLYIGCDRIMYTTLKIYCDQTNSNITTQFLTEHLLTLQHFLQVFNMAATGYAADIQTIF